MRIERIHIKGLFGMFEHDIRLNKEERITVIYGMNGIGKTMIFRILDKFFGRNFSNLFEYNYEQIDIYLTEDKVSKIEIINSKNELKISCIDESEKIIDIFSFSKKGESLRKKLYKFLENSLSIVKKGDVFYKKYDNEILPFNEVAKCIEEYTEKNFQFKENHSVEKHVDYERKRNKVIRITNQIRIYFIETQRLSRLVSIKLPEEVEKNTSKKIQEISIVEECSSRLSDMIKGMHSEYAKLSENFELSLGKRLMNNEVTTFLDEKELKEQSAILEKRREELNSVGLFESNHDDLLIIPNEIDSLSLAVLSVNIQDMKSKLKIFDDIYKKLFLFIKIINERRFSYKKLSIHPQMGFIFTNDNGVKIKSSELSSGEQHELILIYKLLFEVPENSLVLIDEPEISLHVAWQKKFLDDLREIIAIRKFDVMVSTHSPSIINGEWDLAIGLGKEKEEYA